MKRIYFGGEILTMDRSNPRTSAVVTEGGKILFVGPLDEAKKIAPEAISFDLKGKTLLPAFVDGHSHTIGLGIHLNHLCDLTDCSSFEELLERIRAFRKERDLTHGENISCRGYDPEIMKEGCHPTAKLLDSLGFDNPISCVHQSGHVAVYNTVAMRKAGVDGKNFVCPAGGFAGRDENGKLNGYFEEAAKSAVESQFGKKYSYEDIKNAVVTAQEHYMKNGFGTIQEGSGNSSSRLAFLERMAQEGFLKLDLVAYLTSSVKNEALWESYLEKYRRGYCHRLKIGGIKILLDGSPQAKTAWLTQPYQGEREYRGYPLVSDETLESRLRTAMKHRLQVLAHCNGDAASEQFLRVYETIAQKEDVASCRPVMVHAQTVRYDQLSRMKKIGMIPSFFVGHCYFWGDTHIRNLGERGERISPLKAAEERGLIYNLHQDSPVTKPNMLHSVWCAVNRVTRSGVSLGEENKVDCYSALIAATRGGAYSYFEEETKGVLKRGAVADFVVLDRDPTKIPPMEIKDVKVLMTVKNDRIVYSV